MCFPPLVHVVCWFDIEVLRLKCGFFFGPGSEQLPSLCEIGHFLMFWLITWEKFAAFGSATIISPFQIEHVDPHPGIFLDLTNVKLSMLQHYHENVSGFAVSFLLPMIHPDERTHTWANTTSLQWSRKGFSMNLWQMAGVLNCAQFSYKSIFN